MVTVTASNYFQYEYFKNDSPTPLAAIKTINTHERKMNPI